MIYHDTIIIGAGPAGLQMGYFLQKAHRDYLILEGAATAGAFYARYPRHRMLISINKRFNYFEEADFNMRHDWNSLLTEDYGHLFADYSDQLYPHADDMHRYLMDFAAKYDLRICYNTRVLSVQRSTAGTARFQLTAADGNEYSCARLLLATGARKPKLPENVAGIELAETYDNHNLEPDVYKNKRVLVVGRGNSAFEVANHLAGHAAYIHVAIGNRPVDLAWQTHFVGHLRSINNTILEMGYLKSLHAVLGFNLESITRLDDGTLRVAVWEDVPHWQTPGRFHLTQDYDHVILCTGWKYVVPEIFAPDLVPASDERGKYPRLSPSWESSVPHLYFIGTAMAARDRRAASGFIHGFRYNTRTLFHLLEERYEATPYPAQHLPLATEADLHELARRLVERVSRTDALFQLFGVLGDVLVFADGGVDYLQELPVAYVLEEPAFTRDKEMIILTLELGFHHYPEQTNALNFITYADEMADRAHAAFLHPVLRRYCNGVMVEENHLGESLFIRWGGLGVNERPGAYHNMIANMVNRVVGLTDEQFDEQVLLPGAFTPATPENPLPNTYNLPQCSPPSTQPHNSVGQWESEPVRQLNGATISLSH